MPSPIVHQNKTLKLSLYNQYVVKYPVLEALIRSSFQATAGRRNPPRRIALRLVYQELPVGSGQVQPFIH
jgi:hypothetical protein